MKTRNGFVSNSSTSSFVLIGFDIDRKKFDRLTLLSKLYPHNKEVKKLSEKIAKGFRKERCCKHPVARNPCCASCGKPMWKKIDLREELDEEIDGLWCDLTYELDSDIGDIIIEDEGCPEDKILIGVKPVTISSEDTGIDEGTEIDFGEISEKLDKVKKILGLKNETKIKIFGGTYQS